MRAHPVDAPITGEFTTPHEINAEVRELIRVLHAVDGDNLGSNVVTAPKLATGAHGGIRVHGTEVVINRTHSLFSNKGDAYAVPDENGDPWIEEVTTGDGLLKIAFGATWVHTGGTDQSYIWLGVRVDGTLVGQTPIQDVASYEDSATVICDAPVGPGSHLVEPVYGFHESAIPTARSVDFGDRNLSVVEVAR
jgi:hypothetical protein